ncbi:uncharacterized protein LOC144103865 [Amblyomma americanum]
MTPPFELATLSLVILLSISSNLLSSAQAMEESEKKDPCAVEKISRCYASYLDALTSTMSLPADEKVLKAMGGADDVRACSRLKEKLPCHKRIERCPKNIMEQFSRQQESYKFIEDVFCGRSVRNDRTRRYISALVTRCVEIKRFLKCKLRGLKQWKLRGQSFFSTSFLCKALRTSGDCVHSSLKKLCFIPFKLFKVNIGDATHALAELAGCSPDS